MSNTRVSTGGSSGGLGLTFLIASIYAYASTPSLTGWAGAGKAMLVGSGASMGGSIVGIPAALVGGGVGAGLGYAVTGNRSGFIFGGIAGAVICGLGGAGYGIYQGYTISHDWLTNKAEVCEQQPAKTAAVELKGASYTYDAAQKQLTIIKKPAVV